MGYNKSITLNNEIVARVDATLILVICVTENAWHARNIISSAVALNPTTVIAAVPSGIVIFPQNALLFGIIRFMSISCSNYKSTRRCGTLPQSFNLTDLESDDGFNIVALVLLEQPIIIAFFLSGHKEGLSSFIHCRVLSHLEVFGILLSIFLTTV